MTSLLRFPEISTGTEWIGGRYTLPKNVREGGKLVELDVVLWLELPADVIVGSAIIDPRAPLTFAQTLDEAMERPVHGEPRRPSRIRVSDASLAEQLRATEIPVVVAPTAELDAAFADLSATMLAGPDGEQAEHSYLAGGTIAPAVVARLFKAAGLLFRTAPWRRVEEDQVVRVDIPALGVDGACLSIIGGAGESFGLLLFRSLDVYRSFTGEPGPAPRSGKDRALLSLSFDRKKDIPPPMLREIEKHRWPVEGAKGYPVVMSLDDGMASLRLTERDYRILTACTPAFLSFLAQHGDIFAMDDPDDVCASFTGEDGVTVTLTVPYGAQELFDLDGVFAQPEPARSRRRAGRNDPCPCGSGKKYKKCHLDADESAQGAPPERPTVHQMDFRLVGEIGRFAHHRFGPQWSGPEMDLDEDGLTLFLPWAPWTCAVGGTQVADAFLQENASRLSEEEREWFAAQKRAWLSAWEVTHVEPGTIGVRDLLTGELRSVSEELASQSLVARDVVLARVVDHRGTSYFGGLYARSLSPFDADGVVHALRSKLRIREGAVAVEPLRDPELGRFLIGQWRDAVRDADERRSRPPELRNTDGDPLLFVTESFRFAAKSRAEIMKRLAAMDGAERGDEDEILFFRIGASGRRKPDRTVVGRAVLAADTLRVETNSERRGEALARRVRDACAGLLRRAGSTIERPSLERKGAPAEPASEREQALAREYKERHYRDWIDTPLAALGGKSPRAAARSAKWRETLDLLLRDMENRENRRPAAERFDFGRIRSELGLESFSPPE